jgi:spore germination protein GerM
MNDTEKLLGAGSNRRGRVLFYTLVLLLVAAAAWILFWPHDALDTGAPSDLAQRQTPGAGERQAVLYFADSGAQTLVTERRAVPFGESVEEGVEATLRALVAGPGQASAVRTLPAEARLEQTYFADESTTLYLDFNAAFVTQHPGGSTAEYNTISALVRTIAANFPDVTRLQILVDGQPVDTLAGHYDTSKPIDVANWQ